MQDIKRNKLNKSVHNSARHKECSAKTILICWQDSKTKTLCHGAVTQHTVVFANELACSSNNLVVPNFLAWFLLHKSFLFFPLLINLIIQIKHIFTLWLNWHVQPVTRGSQWALLCWWLGFFTFSFGSNMMSYSFPGEMNRKGSYFSVLLKGSGQCSLPLILLAT